MAQFQVGQTVSTPMGRGVVSTPDDIFSDAVIVLLDEPPSDGGSQYYLTSRHSITLLDDSESAE